ncbi:MULTISPECIES: type I-B CRISPR-associated protein Cas5b [Clostridium]|uniref:type I-B CRISPR-associated protein Cas5b n=1 Tax=Clostridium TaxID=1485 RepID=UPI00069E08C0|nr:MULTISPECIES: type I-B CRISPR-associated protein Cas5b [Clostridium]KOF56332.1 CRISPR-associated protein Cas5 [Clostridium sp. DMHC 10]MCD2348872.1 type I-B CRISPR-associated protein Cas5b [Clostridium guangxiense]
MKALKFTLKGQTAFFKKPDVNTYLYFTYGNIHKIAVLGILGAALGFSGYNQQDKKTVYPEFYEKLKDIKIAIVPLNERAYIPKRVQSFNNSVGYASKEAGGNLIVTEQWLEKPRWEIYVELNPNIYGEEIAGSFKKSSFVFLPYLGKNDHFADIEEVEEVELHEEKEVNKLHSLFFKKHFEILKNDSLDLFEEEEIVWKYEERLPVLLEESTNQYITERMVFTNARLELKEKCKVYSSGDKNLFLF